MTAKTETNQKMKQTQNKEFEFSKTTTHQNDEPSQNWSHQNDCQAKRALAGFASQI